MATPGRRTPANRKHEFSALIGLLLDSDLPGAAEHWAWRTAKAAELDELGVAPQTEQTIAASLKVLEQLADHWATCLPAC